MCGAGVAFFVAWGLNVWLGNHAPRIPVPDAGRTHALGYKSVFLYLTLRESIALHGFYAAAAGFALAAGLVRTWSAGRRADQEPG